MKKTFIKSKIGSEPGVNISKKLSEASKNSAIKSLLEASTTTVDEKVATVKTAHYVDKEQFQNAFRTFMGTNKF